MAPDPSMPGDREFHTDVQAESVPCGTGPRPSTLTDDSVESDRNDDGSDPRRLAFLGTLAGGLAHEIKNPLSTMNLNLQLLEEDLQEMDHPTSPKLQRRVQALRGEVRRLEETLNDFLRYAAVHKLNLSPTPLNDVIEEVLDFVEPEANRHCVDIRPYLSPEVGEVPLDVQRFKQALLNLLINAEQAIEDDGGQIVVNTRRGEGEAILEVIDTGCGIDPEVLPKIFEVYYSSKKTGTGLGLPTARRIVEEHGGRIEVESEPGKGTRFRIHLPAGNDQ